MRKGNQWKTELDAQATASSAVESAATVLARTARPPADDRRTDDRRAQGRVTRRAYAQGRRARQAHRLGAALRCKARPAGRSQVAAANAARPRAPNRATHATFTELLRHLVGLPRSSSTCACLLESSCPSARPSRARRYGRYRSGSSRPGFSGHGPKFVMSDLCSLTGCPVDRNAS